MFDGTHLHQSWHDALDAAQTNFRQLTSHSSNEWKRVNVETPQSSGKGKARAAAGPHLSDVVLHRRATKGGTVYRVMLDIPVADEPQVTLEACKSVLSTPELRKEWDPAVENAQLLEMFDQATRITKTNFTLGWPASPRDAVTISRTFNDASTLIDITTSLPRSPDEPAYLRPSPPYVRSEVGLFAWCIQAIPSSSRSPRLRITCFWQHDLRAMWAFAPSSGFGQQLCAMMVGFFRTVKSRGARLPLLTGYGNGVSIEHVQFQIDRVALTIDYAIVPEDGEPFQSVDGDREPTELHTVREHRRLTRAIEWLIPAGEGWDVQISTKASSEEVSSLQWTAHATRTLSGGEGADKFVLNIKHSPLPNDHSVLKVKVIIELSGPSSGWRLNGISQPIEDVEERDPSSYYMSQSILQDTTSMANVSFRSKSTINTLATATSSTSTVPEQPPLGPTLTERTPAAERSILSRVKRNYIYFSSLLQEPEAKWKRTTESRGVSVSQLDSIDPTLVVYRAEATFVGLSLWDLYAAITTPGSRAFWDRLYEDSVFLEDVSQLTELWHVKTKPNWPVNGRDAVVLKTVYKSPTTMHVFAFSADDPNLFPSIPPVDPNVIRTQVDLQGWSIEALSPTTTQVTLLEQSDPKGWSNKASIPQQMISAVAGYGDFVIKSGGPPLMTRLEGAKVNDMRYDHDKGTLRIEYEGCPNRTSSGNDTNDTPVSSSMPTIECELRCDLDNWAASLDIVIDPPPQSIGCLRRHRLSSGGGGLWLTISHDAVNAGKERLQIIVRRAPQGVAKEKGLVMVNGTKVDVDVEELPEREVKNLAKQKRVKPTRIPLDQPPVLGVIRRRRAEWDADTDDNATETGVEPPSDSSTVSSTTTAMGTTAAPAFVSTFSRYWNFAVEQATVTTQQAVAAVSPAMAAGDDAIPSSSKAPMQYALEALSYLQLLHTQPLGDGWTLVSDKGFPVHRKIEPAISSVIPVHKGEKVIEGLSADEIANVLGNYDARKEWDPRYDSAQVFEQFGAHAHTCFMVTKGGFPFRDRGFYLANIVARATPSRQGGGDSEHAGDGRMAVYIAAASFAPDSVQSFASTKYNPYALPVGRIFIEGWILETLDPYGSESYTIPSTRCTRVVAADYAGSIPAAVNSNINTMLVKSIMPLEIYLKKISPSPFTRIPGSSYVIANNDDGMGEKAWMIRKKDSNRTVLTTGFNPTSNTYSSFILLDAIISSTPSPRPPMSPSERLRRATVSLNHSRTNSRIEATPAQPADEGQEATLSKAPSSRSPSVSIRSRSRDALRSSSVFTSRGEVKLPTDLVVGELVVDTKLYRDGYAVKINTMIDKTRQRLSLTDIAGGAESWSDVLPITTAIYTMPPSPLLSSGLNADRPPCHLLRLTLPTAQYQMSTIEDPLTGETRTAPARPRWLLDLDEGRAVIRIEITPSGSKSTAPLIDVNGVAVGVLGEKESLTSLGRDELLDIRTSKMNVLSMTTLEDEPLPAELRTPVAVSTHLLDASASIVVESTDDLSGTENASTPPLNTPAVDSKSLQDHPEQHDASSQQPVDTSSGNGLLRFWTSYPNPLTRFSVSAGAGPILRSLSGTTISTVQTKDPPSSSTSTSQATLFQYAEMTTTSTATTRRRLYRYQLSTVIMVALIAFLIGSLLRSMLSPADFVYVVSDLSEVPGDMVSGWREIKRLLEVKYIIGGWDFQVALVRRH
ncbi:hypothetical protein BDY19DRAFT_930564 [Irpex rosettiformis]|uniref:Uncharacterized protein n=1 Tax=Irpex rosettiformis TaxID=378272 RepID=A0ACB8UAY2_9APHY|nr:hypothetical protein BDY19DRAFT_930564 [Irpex rosettiformis]